MKRESGVRFCSALRKLCLTWLARDAGSKSSRGHVKDAKSSIVLLIAAVGLCATPAGAQPGAVGDLYIARQGGDDSAVLQIDDQTGLFLGLFVPPGNGLFQPRGLVFGPNGNLFVCSYRNDEVVEYDGTNGSLVRVFATGGGLDGAHGLVFGPRGNLFVSSQLAHRVIEYNGSTGEFIRMFATGAPLHYPTGITFGPNGNLFVCSAATDSVIEYVGTTGELVGTFAGSGLLWPVDISFGPNGNLFVLNDADNRVVEFNGSTGALIGTFPSLNPELLLDAKGLTFGGPDENLFVSLNIGPGQAADGQFAIVEFAGETGELIRLFPSDPALFDLCGITIKEHAVPLPTPAVVGFEPSQADNCGVPITTTVSGTGLVPGAIVELVRTGEPDVVGTVVNVTPDTELTVRFNLDGASPDAWDVVLTYPDGQTSTLPNVIEITQCPPLDVTGVVPPEAANCGPVAELEITGAGFSAGATVGLFRPGEPVITGANVDVQSPDSLVAEFDLTGAATGPWIVQVTNPDSSSDVLSDALAVTPCPTPTISAVSHPRALNCGRLVEATISGTDFVTGTTVRLTRPGEPDVEARLVDVQSSDRLVAGFYIVPVVEPGAWDVVVQNTPGGDTASATLEVSPCPPDIKDGNLYAVTVTSAGGVVSEFDATTGDHLGLLLAAGDAGNSSDPKIAFGPNGNVFVVNRAPQLPGSIVELDPHTGELIDVWAPTMWRISDFAFGGPHDNLFVATLSDGLLSDDVPGVVREFDGRTGEPLGIFAVHTARIRSMVWTPNGNLVVGRGESTQFDGLTGDPLGPFGDLGGGYDMELGPNGNLFVADGGGTGSGQVGDVVEFDGNTGEFIRIVASVPNSAFGLEIRPNGNLLVCGILPGSNIYGFIEFQLDGTLVGMFAPSPTLGPYRDMVFRPLAFGDFDQNGFIELDDYEQFQSCFTGPAGGPVGIECTLGDFDRDTDVDFADFAAFQRVFVPLPDGACCIEPGSCIDEVEPTCEEEGSVYMGDETSCLGVECDGRVYENVISPGEFAGFFYSFALLYSDVGLSARVGDDIRLAGTARDLLGYDLVVAGASSCWHPDFGSGTGGPFDVTVKLYTGCPGPGGGAFLIPGTAATWTNIPADGFGYLLQADGFSGVTLTDEVWMVLSFSTDCSGWVTGERAEVAFTADKFFYEIDHDPWVCTPFFFSDPYAGFQASIRAVEGTAATGSPTPEKRLSVTRIETGEPLVPIDIEAVSEAVYGSSGDGQ